VGQARSGCQPYVMMLHICPHAQSRLACAFSRSMLRAVNASLNPDGKPQILSSRGCGVGSVVMTVLAAEPIVTVAGSWCGPEGCGPRRSRDR
jgi:hypothetical protein